MSTEDNTVSDETKAVSDKLDVPAWVKHDLARIKNRKDRGVFLNAVVRNSGCAKYRYEITSSGRLRLFYLAGRRAY